MIIKEAVYEERQITRTVLIEPEVHGCDCCGVEINEEDENDHILEMDVFYHEKETERLSFCSWDCALTFLPKVKTDYFGTLPYVSFHTPIGSKRGAERLIELLRNGGLITK